MSTETTKQSTLKNNKQVMKKALLCVLALLMTVTVLLPVSVWATEGTEQSTVEVTDTNTADTDTTLPPENTTSEIGGGGGALSLY
jgi:hypothetical protein